MCVRTCEQTHSSWNELARTHFDSLSVLRGVGISDYALKEKCETLHACFESVLTLSSANGKHKYASQELCTVSTTTKIYFRFSEERVSVAYTIRVE